MAEGQTKDWEYKLETAAGTFHNSSGDHSGEGKATITFEDGRVETYEGEYNEQVRYGHGVYKYHNGDVYTGSWQGGNKAGIGSLVYAEAKDGEGEGEGEASAVSRKGKYVGHYGGESAGEHAENVRHGSGSFTYANGDTYSGQWVRGKKHGQGTYCFAGDQTRLVGMWSQGKCVSGKWIFPNGTYYIGKFENGKPNGEGNWVFKNGSQLCGVYTQKPKEGQEEAAEGEEAKTLLVDAEWESTGIVAVQG